MNWHAEIIEHKNESRILVRFDKNNELIERFKKLAGRRFSKTLGAWHLPDNTSYRNQFGLQPKSIGKEALFHIHPINQKAFRNYINEIKLKGYSENTLKNYMSEFAQLLYILKDKSVDELTNERLRNYFLYCRNELKLSESSLHSRINATKFYFEKVLKGDKVLFDIPRPKKHLILPKIVSEEKILKTLLTTENLKHKTILMLAYSAGLRVSEVLNIKLSHINSERKQLLIEKSKGKKDRYVPIGNYLLELLKIYYKEFKPQNYLFEGQFGNQKYSSRSAQIIFKEAMKKCGAPSTLSFHSLRHSYATHLLEAGTDIKYIQELLGHNDIKTTLRYTHVSQKELMNIENPLDKLLRKVATTIA